MIKIIAEFCQNHNGDWNILKEMIEQAAEAGATHGKIQSIFVEDLTNRERFENGKEENGRTSIIKRPFQPEYDRLKKLELTYKQHEDFIEACKKGGLSPLTTAFSTGSINMLKELDWAEIKVASYDCASETLIKELSNSFENIIISTGATYDHEIEKTAQILTSRNVQFTFLHCVTIYPTPLNEIHLNRMNSLKKYTPSIGLSEHTLVRRDGIKASLAAIFEGAEYIERHFTVLAEDQTKDGPVSIRKEHVEELVKFSELSKEDQRLYLNEKVSEYPTMLGSTDRVLSHEELLNRDYYRGRFATQSEGNIIYNWEENETI
jgi:N,N'-diacetyllegionaminate synthase